MPQDSIEMLQLDGEDGIGFLPGLLDEPAGFGEGDTGSGFESVIALCPNCHYRVHHGKDGDEYNRNLLKVVHNLENVD